MPQFDLFSKLLKINPLAGKFVTIGLLVLTAAAVVVSFGVALDSLIRTGAVVIAFSVAVFILVNLHGLLIRVIGWVLTIAFCVWLSALVAQTLTGGKISWLAPTQCLIFPLSNSCAITQGSTTEMVTAALDETDPPADDAAQPDRGGDAPQAPEVAPHPPVKAVFVQFAGLLSREDITEYATTLTEEGWPVEGAERGGERTGKSAGLNEIRFFHPEDRPAAEILAVRSSELSPAGHALSVRDLSETAFSTPDNVGVLEVWISN